MKKLYGIFVFFLLWYILASVYINIVPYPQDVISNLIRIYPYGFNKHILASLQRLLFGLTIAIFLGIHIGVLLGITKKADSLISPVVYAMYPIPKAALLPVFIIILGIGDLTKISLIVFIAIFPIIVNTKDAVKHIPNEVFYVAKSLSLSKLQMYKDIIIPAILPNVLTSIRIGIGTSVAVLYLSEAFHAKYGLGYYINIQQSVSYLNVFTGIFALGLIGTVLFIIVDLLEKKLCAWL